MLLKRVSGKGVSFNPDLLYGCRALKDRGRRAVEVFGGLFASTVGATGGSGVSWPELSPKWSSHGWVLVSGGGLDCVFSRAVTGLGLVRDFFELLVVV